MSYETGDAGAIYTGRDFTARGTSIAGNFFHDIQAGPPGLEVKGIYLDDEASGIAIRGNIFARVQQPVFLGGGRDNLIEDNLFYWSTPAVRLDARGLGTERQNTLDPKGTLQQGLNAVPYRGALYASRYPNLATIREDDFGAPKYNVFRRNVIIGGQTSNISAEARTGIEIVKNRVGDESVFENQPTATIRRRVEDFQIAKDR